MFRNNFSNKKGFTLIETLVGTAVFLIIATASYQAYVSLFALISLNQYKILALNLANEQFEIVRNLSYSRVGVTGSIPNGDIPHIQNLTRGGVPFIVTTTIRNVDQPFDGTLGGTPNDISPADNKMVEVQIDCPTCKSFTPVNLTTTVAPKNLETASTNGALFVKVFDANGIVVSDASVHIVNNKVSPAIVIDDTTDNNGFLQIVDAPLGVEAYEITVTKSGYSTDKTYPSSGSSIPLKPHATVVLQQVTQISFAIDKLSTASFSSVSPTCVSVPNISFSLTGSKMIDQDTHKYSSNLATNASGVYSNSSMEWDSYTVKGIDTSYDIVGINPLNDIAINPNSNQTVDLIVLPKDPNSLLVTVKDGTTYLPVTDAVVTLSQDGFSIDTKITNQGFINQTDWSGGSGQSTYTDTTKYSSDDGNIDISNPNGELKLKNAFGNYNPNGVLESSTFDTGSFSNFHNVSWLPSDQPVNAGAQSVKIQLASSTSPPTVWDYKGPDGSSGTYYTVSDSSISSVHNGDRYIRYKVFLSTQSSTSTPNISDISFTFTSSCTPPGQVIFSGLSSGTYHISVSKTGYTTVEADISVSSSWKEQEIILAP